MVSRKKFIVVAYDITNDKVRSKFAKHLEKYGVRINFSVFECMMTPKQLQKTQEYAAKIIDTQTDSVAFYSICLNCYVNMTKIPEQQNTIKLTHVV